MAPFIKFNWHGAKILSLVEIAGRESNRDAAERVLARAQEHVPFETGALKDTGVVSTDGDRAAVSYNTVYAARLHQHPEYNFAPPGEGRWLQNAVEAEEHDTLMAFAKPFRKRFV